VAGGPERDGTQRRGWLHRHHGRRSPAEATQAADVAHLESDDDTAGRRDGVDPGDSLDQVLRRAAEARDAERDPDD
jgi:hypothetical protein